MRRTISWLAILLVTGAAAGGCAAIRQESEATPAPPPLSCGDVLTEDSTLTGDLDCREGAALTIAGDGVTLDLGGHTITGPGPGRRSWPVPDFNVVGVRITGDGATLRNGTISEFGISVLAEESSGATIEAVATTGSYYGIYLFGGGEHAITSNVVEDNVYGLTLFESHANLIVSNSLSEQTHFSPGGYGIYLSRSERNRIEFNEIRENLNWGLWFSDSSNNTIVRNNIISNDPQVSDDSGGNQWYDPARREGNFWDDFAGPDEDGDGIGDLPYFIGGPGRSQDIYPFVAASGWDGRASETASRPTPTPRVAARALAFVATANGEIVRLDLERDDARTLATISSDIVDLALAPDGATVYVATETAGVLAVDAETGAEVGRWGIDGAAALAATYDNERLIVSTFEGTTEIDLASGEMREMSAGANAVAMLPSWKHNLIYAALPDRTLTVLYLPDRSVPYVRPIASPPVQAVDNRSGTRIYLVFHNLQRIEVIETEHFDLVDEIRLDVADPSEIRVAPGPDGSVLYMLDRELRRVEAIDLETKTAEAIAELDFAPLEIGVFGDGLNIIITGTRQDGSGVVSILTAGLDPVDEAPLASAPVAAAVAR